MENQEPETRETKAVIATLEEIAKLAKARKELPAVSYTCPETNMIFTFRRLTGADMDKIQSWSDGDETKYQQIMVEQASVEPKINLPFWSILCELSPIVRSGITMFVREISGLGDDAIEKAKNASKQVVA